MNRGINRREFLRWSMGAALGLMAADGIGVRRDRGLRGKVRIRLVTPDEARRTDVRFCERTVFATAADAVRAAAQRGMEGEIYVEGGTGV